MSRDWTFYLEDILDAARKILRYTQDIDFDEFNRNELIFDGVVRNLEIIGEAAKNLPDEARAMMPDIEWSKVAAFRDVVAYRYSLECRLQQSARDCIHRRDTAEETGYPAVVLLDEPSCRRHCQ